MEISKLYSAENPIFRQYAYYSALLGFKMIVVSFITTYYRFTRKVFLNPEDVVILKGAKVGTHPAIDRAMRIHRNDLENIPLFWILGLLYVATSPSVATASLCFRVFGATRIIHTIVYLFQVPQPSRALAFGAGVIVNAFMGFKILSSF